MEYTIPKIAIDWSSFEEKKIYGGLQHYYTFPNGYGAIINHHEHSQGIELSVTKYGVLCQDTHITKDVINNIDNAEELKELLEAIKKL